MKAPSKPSTFFTSRQIAQQLQVSERTVRRWIDKGDLTAHRLGRVVRVSARDLEVFLALRRLAD